MVARSTIEARYIVIVVGVVKMLWLRTLLVGLKMNQENQMRLWCNNKSAISIADNLVQHDRTKHIEIDRFFIKEKLSSCNLVQHYRTKHIEIDKFFIKEKLDSRILKLIMFLLKIT